MVIAYWFAPWRRAAPSNSPSSPTSFGPREAEVGRSFDPVHHLQEGVTNHPEPTLSRVVVDARTLIHRRERNEALQAAIAATRDDHPSSVGPRLPPETYSERLDSAKWAVLQLGHRNYGPSVRHDRLRRARGGRVKAPGLADRRPARIRAAAEPPPPRGHRTAASAAPPPVEVKLAPGPGGSGSSRSSTQGRFPCVATSSTRSPGLAK